MGRLDYFWLMPKPLMRIIWEYCGDLRFRPTRLHKFACLEIKAWDLLIGAPLQPSVLTGSGRKLGDTIKEFMNHVYDKSQKEATLREGAMFANKFRPL